MTKVPTAKLAGVFQALAGQPDSSLDSMRLLLKEVRTLSFRGCRRKTSDESYCGSVGLGKLGTCCRCSAQEVEVAGLDSKDH